MKVLITGAKGQLGSELQATCPADTELILTDAQELDITNAAQIQQTLVQTQPAIVINAAAYTAVDKAETDAALAYAIYATAVEYLAKATASHSIYFLQISTDFVFDGTASMPYATDAALNPLGVYGASKAQGEQLTQQYNPQAAIIRTSWLYSAYGANFVKTMLRLMAEREQLGVIADQIGTPTWTNTLAQTLWHCCAQRPAGIWHCADNGVASWYDFAVAIQEEALRLGLLSQAIPIKPLRTAQYPTPAQRPAYSVMDKQATESLLGASLPHWRVSLRSMLKQLKAQGAAS